MFFGHLGFGATPKPWLAGVLQDGLWCLWIQQGDKFGRLCRVLDDNEQQLRSKTDDWQVTKLIAAASDGGCWIMHGNGHLCKVNK